MSPAYQGSGNPTMPIATAKNPLRLGPWLRWVCFMFALQFTAISSISADEVSHSTPRLRRPVTLSLDVQQQQLYVANRCGTISILDTTTGHLQHEFACGERLDWLTPLGTKNSRMLLAVDSSTHSLIVLEKRDSDSEPLRVIKRMSMSHSPVFVTTTDDGTQVFVSSLWSRRVTSVVCKGDPVDPKSWHIDWQTNLSYAPRVLRVVSNPLQLLVADAFGGNLGIVNPTDGTFLHTRQIPGHQLRGLEVTRDGKHIVIAQQLLNDRARTDFNDIHWGLLMSNDLWWLNLAAVRDSTSDLFRDSHIHPLGEAGRATADPAGLTILRDGTVAVTLGGMGEIAYGKSEDYVLRRLKVGRRPTAIVADETDRRLFIANTFDDSISVVDLNLEEQVAVWSLGPKRPLSLAEQGELAFYDGRFSMDGWMSCHSCHIDGHTNGQLNDNTSDGSFETPKRVLSLLGKSGTEPLGWNGNAPTFSHQLRRSIEETMGAREPVDTRTIEALTAYIRTLPPPPSLSHARGEINLKTVARGKQVFEAKKCGNCHTAPLYTSTDLYDVGLADEKNVRSFNPPSLLGVSQRMSWLHDGRAESLQQVFEQVRHQLETPLSKGDLRDLIAFLNQL